MTVNHGGTGVPARCADYDPMFKLHGCELGAHAADKPHRDLLGNEWRESLQLPCPSISNEGAHCTLHFGHFPARHRDGEGEEWTDAIYDASGPRKAVPEETTYSEPRCETCGATSVLEKTLWRSMADGTERARYFCNDRPACNDRRFPELAALFAGRAAAEDAPGFASAQPRAAYERQLAGRVAEVLGDVDLDARLDLLGVMDEGDLRAALAWLIAYAPQWFDFALVRDEARVDRLQERLDEYADEPQPYCTECGATIGIFIGHGPDWHHYRGNGTVETPSELYDAGHAPAVAWREAGAQ